VLEAHLSLPQHRVNGEDQIEGKAGQDEHVGEVALADGQRPPPAGQRSCAALSQGLRHCAVPSGTPESLPALRSRRATG
jgi:hypothetical protein